MADGAMGTMLYEKGVFINRCYDELNLSTPTIVREVHEAYVKAGAQILETNTFGANRTRLAAFGTKHPQRAEGSSFAPRSSRTSPTARDWRRRRSSVRSWP